jgi:hypothetical protein
MARRRILYRKFPTQNPRNGLVLFPAQWLIGLTGPIEIDVTTEVTNGEPLIVREVLTGTVELSGRVEAVLENNGDASLGAASCGLRPPGQQVVRATFAFLCIIS